MPEFLPAIRFALFHLGKLTPFAWLAALGAAAAALGAIAVLLASEALNLETRLDFRRDPGARAFGAPLSPGEPGFGAWLATIGYFENGYYIFLAGMVLLAIGIYPFVAAAAR